MKRPIFNKISPNINDYLLLIISLVTIIGAGVYYFYSLNVLGLILVIILTIAIFIPLHRRLDSTKREANSLKMDKKLYLFPIVYIILFLISLLFLYKGQSSRPLISPWETVSTNFFIFYALSSVLLIWTLTKKSITNLWKTSLISLHYFLSLVVAVIVYKIGYGFDPFIHQATMELIDKKGIVDPKTPYYLGQYSLIIIFHKLTGISIYMLSKLLVPVLVSIFLPLSLFRFLKEQSNKVLGNRFLTILFLLVLGFSPLILTTPQNLSYLFLLLTIFLSLNPKNYVWTLVLAIATLAIHPLTGIPAISWGAWLLFKKYTRGYKKLAKSLITILIISINAIFLPIALLLTGANDFKGIGSGLSALIGPFKNIFGNLSSAGREDWMLNLVYFIGNNISLFIIIIIIASIIYFSRQVKSIKKEQLVFWQGLAVINGSLLLSYVLSSQIIFGDLINYEQSNYASRILVIIVIFCLPFIVFLFNNIIQRILEQNLFIKGTWLIVGTSLLLISLYTSYPRFDKYHNSRGYSTSQNDIMAVNLINNIAKDDYVVLANQQVSAAALKELGFDNYYNTNKGPIFFYPIPTGGPLYQHYLDMVYKNPEIQYANEAMDLVGVSELYLVVNKYWHQSSRVIGEAKLVANSWEEVNNEIYIFKYSR